MAPKSSEVSLPGWADEDSKPSQFLINEQLSGKAESQGTCHFSGESPPAPGQECGGPPEARASSEAFWPLRGSASGATSVLT